MQRTREPENDVLSSARQPMQEVPIERELRILRGVGEHNTGGVGGRRGSRSYSGEGMDGCAYSTRDSVQKVPGTPVGEAPPRCTTLPLLPRSSCYLSIKTSTSSGQNAWTKDDNRSSQEIPRKQLIGGKEKSQGLG